MTSTPPPTRTFNPSTPTGRDTFVVLGAARGGTSMVAGALRMLGVPMGEEIDAANNEDRAFLGHRGDLEIFDRPAKADMRTAYLEQVRAVIQQRNKDKSIWGWKDPAASYYLGEVLPDVRNPRLVFITRDPSATLSRRTSDRHRLGVTRPQRPSVDFNRILNQYRDGLDLTVKHDVPMLLVSYERVLRAPEAFIDALSEFAGKDFQPDATLRAALIDYVEPGRGSGLIDPALSGSRRTTNPDSWPVIPALDDSAQAWANTAPFKALSEGRLGKARQLAEASLGDMSATHPIAGGSPSVIAMELANPARAPLPADAGPALFTLGLVALQDSRALDAYWYMSAAVTLADRYAHWTAPYASSLYHLGLAARLCQMGTSAQLSFQRLLSDQPPIHDLAVREDPIEQFAHFAELAQTQLKELKA